MAIINQEKVLKQLGQALPADMNAVSIYSPPAGTTVRVTGFFAANTTGSAATFRLFHDEDGTTYSTATALYYDVSVAANTTFSLSQQEDPSILMGNSDGNLAVRTGTNSAFCFTVYGEEIIQG